MTIDPPAAIAAPSATVLRECRYGRMLYLRNDVYIGRSLELYGEYCEAESALFAQLLSPGQVVIEVGANIGAHTVHLGPGGMMLAFEPQRIIFSLLCANLALNEQFHVRPIHAAIGEADGLVKLPALDPYATQNFGGFSVRGRNTGDDVPVFTLDRYGLPSLRLIKIDVEGMEAEVLRGASKLIARHRPVIYCENDRRDGSAALIGLIQQYGYDLYWHLPALYSPNNFAGNPEDVFPGVISVNMVCFPAETQQPVANLRRVSGPPPTIGGMSDVNQRR
jgi:FkbM family methyltransferase